MMNKLSLKETVTAAGVVLSFTLFSISPAKAASFTFSQENWQYGGSLSGFFSGDDFNNDGNITDSEVSTFSAIFEGNLYAPYPTPTGEPVIEFFSINFSLLPPEPLPPPDEPFLIPYQNFAFNYSTSSSELSFSLYTSSCYYGPPCLSGGRISNSLEVSSSGGNIILSLFPAQLGSPPFTTSSSSAPVETPLQQSIPESSTLIGTLLASLSFLLRKKSYLSSLQNK